ncbi:hypothetical protein [Nocardioides marmoraquaticus]
MPRRTTVLAAGALLALLAGCGGEPEPLEALPPAAPDDLCSLVPEAAADGLTGTSSSSQDGDPTAACALRGSGGDSILVTYLQLEGEPAARQAWESQCTGIDPSTLPEQQVDVEGADETCAGASDERASIALLTGRDLVTVRVSAPEPPPLERATTIAEGVVAELPDPE